MLRVTLKGIRGHLVRFLLTALAVMLGVAFVAGTYILRDSMNGTLDDLLTSSVKGVDVDVRGVSTNTETDQGTVRKPVQLALADQLAKVDGVADARPDLQGSAMLVGKDGLIVRNGGAPTLGLVFRANDPSFTVIAGAGPSGPGEVVVEEATLKKSGLAVGDTTQAVFGGQVRPVRISGEVRFGSLFGATAILLDDATARSAFAPDGTVSGISLSAASGVTPDQLRTRVASVLPSGAEAVTAKTLEDETRKSVDQVFSVFTTFLLVFAGIALFVGGFIIVNTFSIVVAQRTRELALLRAVGASRSQVRTMVLAESFVIGLVGSGLGIALGLALAAGLKAVIKGFLGLDIAGGLPLGTQTVVTSVVVGVVVTVAAALMPAVRAARIPPVAAMRDDMVMPVSSIRRRGIIGSVIFVVGSVLLTYEVTRTEVGWGLAGLGFTMVIIGALVAAPLATRPVVRVINWPFQQFGGVVGRLAGQNALRIPRRTANTASALMIGLVLVAGLAVIASSTKASFAGLVEKQLTADYVLSAGRGGQVPAGLVTAAQGVSGVQSVATLSALSAKLDGHDVTIVATTGAGLSQNVRIDLVSGAIDAIDRGELLVDQSSAKANGWTVGSQATGTIGTLTDQRITIGGVYKDTQFLGSTVGGRALYEKALPAAQQRITYAFVKAAPGANTTGLETALKGLAKPYVVVSVETGAEFVNTATSSVDTLLGLLYVLLALSIIIAVIGIINTLALSVVERTREIGLLRAVGLRRRQLAGMITIESVSTALFGAVLGAALGIGLGAALQHGLRDDGLDVLSIPWGTIVFVLVASAVVGVIAAVLPAVRAVRLNILKAISTD